MSLCIVNFPVFVSFAVNLYTCEPLSKVCTYAGALAETQLPSFRYGRAGGTPVSPEKIKCAVEGVGTVFYFPSNMCEAEAIRHTHKKKTTEKRNHKNFLHPINHFC
jgi:hypothetical protein